MIFFMKFKKLLLIVLLLPLLTSCFATGEVGTNPTMGIQPGQWTKPVPAGKDKWMTRGWAAGDVMNGGTAFCAKRSKDVETIDLKTGDSSTAAVLIFSCY